MAEDAPIRGSPVGLEFRFVFSAVALASVVLGYVGLHQHVGGGAASGPGVLDILYWDLQLFVLGSSPLDTGTDLPVALEIARFSAPAATAYALFTTAHALLRGQIDIVRARRSRGHTVVCGADLAVGFLARQLVAEGRRVVIVDPAVVAGAAGWTALPGTLVVAGDPREREVLRRAAAHRAREVMAFTADSAFNAEVVLALDALAASAGSGSGVTSSVACYAEVDDPELCAAMMARTLSSSGPSPSTVEFFSRHERAARRLADWAPVRAVGDGQEATAVLVVGDGPLARALVVELARRSRLARRRPGVAGEGGPPADPLPVAVIGAGADDLAARLPLPAGALALEARAADPSAVDDLAGLTVPAAGCGRAPTHVFVCLDDDSAGIRFGLVASDLLADAGARVVVAVVQGTVFGRVLGAGVALGGELRPPGRGSAPVLHNVTEAVYSPDAVRHGLIDDIARSAHDSYLAAGRRRGETPDANPALVPWDELPERLREANRAQAADIGRKLAAVRCVAVPRTAGAPPFAFADDDVEHLARLEHDRWLRAMRAQGWSRGPERDEARRRHPDLVAWDELTEVGRDKDRSAVRAIPGQLEDAGFMILRGPSRSARG